MYPTKTITVLATNGDTLHIKVPSEVPSNERAEMLRGLYNKHVKHPGGHWKGPCEAIVPSDMVALVGEAMGFMGSLLDSQENLDGGLVKLYSKGYWAHGF